MRRVRLFVTLSWIALTASVVAVIASLSSEWSWIVALLMWNHVLIIVVFAVAVFNVRKLPKSSLSEVFKAFPPWIVALGIACVVVAAPIWSANKFDLGKTDTGEQVSRKNWYVEGEKYFIRLNNNITKEITKGEYDELVRDNFEFFARMWVLFSFGCLAFWRYIGHNANTRPNAS